MYHYPWHKCSFKKVKYLGIVAHACNPALGNWKEKDQEFKVRG